MDSIITVDNVTQSFGTHLVYRHVSFTVAKGEIFVILGGSGCGKSVLMRQIVGLLPPTEGAVTVLGHDIYADGHNILSRIGVMYQSGALFGAMTLLENVMLPLEMLTDKRSFGVRLSATGERKWKAAMPHWQKAQEEIGVILGHSNLRQLLDLVDDANLKFEQLETVE